MKMVVNFLVRHLFFAALFPFSGLVVWAIGLERQRSRALRSRPALMLSYPIAQTTIRRTASAHL